MNAKSLSIIASIIGGVCATGPAYVLFEILSNREAYGMAVAGGGIDDRVFWWALSGAALFLALGCLGCLLHRQRRHAAAA